MIVRKLDCLGRVVIPKEIRDFLSIENESPVAITMNGDTVHIKKFIENKVCLSCNTEEDLVELEGKHICHKCIKSLYGKIKDGE